MNKSLNNNAEYQNAVSELLLFSEKFGMNPQEFYDKFLVLKKIESYEEANHLPPEARFGYKMQTRNCGRLAIISDIHGNYEGLLAVLDDIEKAGCDSIICLGDLVDGGTQDEAVVREIRKRNIRCVRGNHDETHSAVLDPETESFLKKMPEDISEGDIVFTHISPRVKKKKIKDEFEAWNVFDETHYRIVFVGHVHIPVIYGSACDETGSAKKHPFEYNKPFQLDETDRYIICPGAVGFGRDLVGKIRYGIFDYEEKTFEFRAADGPLLAYDYAINTKKTAIDSFLPDFNYSTYAIEGGKYEKSFGFPVK